MNIVYNQVLEFITPAFVAGADQNKPEIRASSIRGELRWWFRSLGGSLEEESDVFGSVQGDVKASAVVVRVYDFEARYGQEISLPPMSDKAYLYYFAKVSGNKEGVHRTSSSHYFAPGTRFRLVIGLRRDLSHVAEERLMRSLRIFSALGALGLRATRGCGAIACDKRLSRDDLRKRVEECGDGIAVRLVSDETYTTGEKCQVALGSFLRSLRKENHISGKERSALGYSQPPERASSALRLRPVKVDGVYLPVVIYTDAACAQPSLKELIERQTISA